MPVKPVVLAFLALVLAIHYHPFPSLPANFVSGEDGSGIEEMSPQTSPTKDGDVTKELRVPSPLESLINNEGVPQQDAAEPPVVGYREEVRDSAIPQVILVNSQLVHHSMPLFPRLISFNLLSSPPLGSSRVLR